MRSKGAAYRALESLKAHWLLELDDAADRMEQADEGSTAKLVYSAQVNAVDTCLNDLDTALAEAGMELDDRQVAKAREAEVLGRR